MKIYKFRALSNDDDYRYVKDIIGNNRFKCSNFQELNDPMEGVFSILMESDNKEYAKEIKKIIGKVYSEKMKFKISCFSADKKEKRGFNNPAMWGHYANGFKGVAIEVEIKDDYKKYFKEMNYNDCDLTLNDVGGEKEIKIDDALIKKVLRHKKTAWKHEDEIRLLVNKEDDKDEILTNKNGVYFANIGDITAIYFGDPYGNIENKIAGVGKNESFLQYNKFKEKIKQIAKDNKIKWFDVKVEKGEVKIK